MKTLLISVIVCFFLCPWAVASTVKNKDRGYSVTLPETWRTIPSAVVIGVIKEVAATDSTFARDRIEQAFQPNNLKEWFGSPHILVEYRQLENPRRLRLDQYEAQYTPEIRKKGKGLAGSLTPFTSVDSISFSHNANTVWVKAVTRLGGVPVIHMLAGFIPTPDGILKIYCYSEYEERRIHEKVFTEIISSVVIGGSDVESVSFFESMNATKVLMIFIGSVFFGFFVIALKKNLS